MDGYLDKCQTYIVRYEGLDGNSMCSESNPLHFSYFQMFLLQINIFLLNIRPELFNFINLLTLEIPRITFVPIKNLAVGTRIWRSLYANLEKKKSTIPHVTVLYLLRRNIGFVALGLSLCFRLFKLIMAEDWKNWSRRQRIIQQIDEYLKQTNETKSALELENSVFLVSSI
ncbi:hypothetical protein Avbf_09429 [Armadillidium vulgare]|nr:hypothetical protein Avbf_09429 [Armadillidium vulgare]